MNLVRAADFATASFDEMSTLKSDTMSESKSVKYLREWLDQEPQASYENEQLLACKAITHLQEEIAQRMAPHFNLQVQIRPKKTVEEKKSLGKWLNVEMTKLDLALKCPRTGLPSHLYGYSGREAPDDGLFQFSATYPDGRRSAHHRTAQLEGLEFVPRVQWRERIHLRDDGRRR